MASKRSMGMKRLWIGILVLAVILASGIWLTLRFSRIHKPVEEHLQQAAEAARDGNWQKATALAENARAEWMKYRRLIAATTDHEPLEQAQYLLDQLQVYAQAQRTTEFCALCVRLASLAAAMEETQQVSWWNLLSDVCPGRTAPVCRGRNGSR